MTGYPLTFSEDRVDSRSQHLGIGGLDGFLLSILGVGWVVGDIVALGLQLSNALQQLGGMEAEMLGSLMMLPSGVLASSPRAASSSGIFCSGISLSGK